MITFTLAILALILGFFFYGKYVESVFGASVQRETPAVTHRDNVDYIPMSTWRVYLIQFLNIAGTGPIFGAILGILFGPAAYIWIVVGCIFFGATHDYLSGMISVRSNGSSLPEIIGDNLGITARQIMRLFSLVLLLLLGAVYVITCADLLATLTNDSLGLSLDTWSLIWKVAIFVYFLLATLLPIDTLIGKLYPLFGAALIIMAVGVGISIYSQPGWLPEIVDAPFVSHHPSGTPLLPFLCVTIACGAISGFHGTQSPLMARCIKNEKRGHFVFYGAMITEGIVACIWAAAAIKFAAAQGGVEGEAAYTNLSTIMKGNPAILVNMICTTWMGRVGALLAVLGVVAAPITSGDTAFRSARLIIAEITHFKQDIFWKRLLIAIPCFIIAYIVMNINFQVLWNNFAWCNQSIATITLWAATFWLVRNKKNFFIALIPAVCMTFISTCYCLAWEGTFHLPISISYIASGIITLILIVIFFWKKVFHK